MASSHPPLLRRLWNVCVSRWPQYTPRAHALFGDDEDPSSDEWKVMAWLSGACLLFGITGLLSEHFHANNTLTRGLYLAAYLCGGWDAAGDAWERIRKGQLDVHFLMLAVAIGAALIGAWREGSLLLFLFSASGAMEHFAMGRMTFSDEIRKESVATLRELHRQGMHTVMLTGDHAGAASRTGKQVGIDEVLSELSPEKKVEAIERLKEKGKVRVAMIGDGVNDAPCIAAADVGIAMGARGSDAALEQAEIVLMNDRIENFLLARMLSVHAKFIIQQNIAVALGTVLVMVCTAFIFPIPLTFGVAAHEGSTLLVVLNSLRLLAIKLPALSHEKADLTPIS